MMVPRACLSILIALKACRAYGRFAALGLLVLFAALQLGCATQPTETKPKPTVRDPQQVLVFLKQGASAYDQGDISGAIEAWQQSVELNPDDAVTLNNLALLLKREHRFNEAVELLKTGIKRSPEVAELHYNLAVISELYLLDLNSALVHYQRYQSLAANEDKKVTGWIADLERRLD